MARYDQPGSIVDKICLSLGINGGDEKRKLKSASIHPGIVRFRERLFPPRFLLHDEISIFFPFALLSDLCSLPLSLRRRRHCRQIALSPNRRASTLNIRFFVLQKFVEREYHSAGSRLVCPDLNFSLHFRRCHASSFSYTLYKYSIHFLVSLILFYNSKISILFYFFLRKSSFYHQIIVHLRKKLALKKLN